MPSGPKKRKALKKKKELASHSQDHDQEIHSTGSSVHENEDLKYPDDKESDGDDVNSPSSDDCGNHQLQFADGDKEEIGKADDSSMFHFSSASNQSSEGAKDSGVAAEKTVVEEFVFGTEGELQARCELNIHNIFVEHVEAQKESGDGVSSQNKDSVVQVEMGTEQIEELHAKNAAVEDVESQKEPSDGGLAKVDNGEAHVIDKINVVVDNSPFDGSTEAVNLLSDGLTQVPYTVRVGELFGSVVESGLDDVTDTIETIGEKISISSFSSGDSFTTSNVAIQGTKGNAKKEDCALDQKDVNLHMLVESAEENKNETIIAANDSGGVLDGKGSAAEESKEASANCGNASNGAENIKFLEVHESPDTQPLLPSSVQPVTRTSWLSCCGLLDLTGSNR